MLVLTMNFRAYSELQIESKLHEELNEKVQLATSENLLLQEEIYYLKNDPDTIEREVRKFGFVPPKENIISNNDPKARAAKQLEPALKNKEKVSRAGEPDKAEKSANRQSPTRK